MSQLAIKKLSDLIPPKNVGVIIGSTPVISFGDFTTANVATLGINPSSEEFLTGETLLPLMSKRLVDFESLGTPPHFPLTPVQSEKVWKGCANYFNSTNTYWRWFGHLEEILLRAGFSYKNGTACHLDLSPWSTKPVWRALTSSAQQELVENGRELLWWQCANTPLRALIFNGRQAFDAINSYSKLDLNLAGEIRYKSGDRTGTSKLYIGEGPLGQTILGWTLNIQELRTSPEEKERIKSELGSWIKRNLSE